MSKELCATIVLADDYWVAAEEAIASIMVGLECDRREAERLYERMLENWLDQCLFASKTVH